MRVENFKLQGLLSSIVFIDLVDQDEAQALDTLYDGVKRSCSDLRSKPLSAPSFPGSPSKKVSYLPFPGVARDESTIPASVELSLSAKSKRFVHSCVVAGDWLQFAEIGNPYVEDTDPTDISWIQPPVRLKFFFWSPPTDYFKERNIQSFTPIVVLCTTEAELLQASLQQGLSPELFAKLQLQPGKFFNQDREALYPAIGTALADSFVTAVVVPSVALVGARSHPEIAYQAIVDLVLVPLLDMHGNLPVAQLSLSVADVGAESKSLLAMCKKVSKRILGRSSMSYTVMNANEQAANSMPIAICRHLAWAISRHHNHEDKAWIDRILHSLNKVGVNPSRLEKSTPG